jgi:UDP-N-acetylglucosamine--N-acetylmuramyl-(pentapeptide) pyrophosphoryl-undecaprenol N-acetylglucosamine transferase
LSPDVIFATGGFVSLPPVIAGRMIGIPAMVHEQTAVVGLANRIAGRLARRVALTFAETRHSFPPEKVVVTGNPLRPELHSVSRDTAVAQLGLDPSRPVVYVTGGAQGSHAINRAVGVILQRLTRTAQIIHQCGDHPTTGDRQWIDERRRLLPLDQQKRYRVVPYVGGELREIYSAANLVVGRAGAGTVNECCHLGLPALLIPLPGSGGGEQMVNARLMERAGGAVVLTESELTPDRLLTTIGRLLDDPVRLKAMGERARSLAVPDAASRIIAELLSLAGLEL